MGLGKMYELHKWGNENSVLNCIFPKTFNLLYHIPITSVWSANKLKFLTGADEIKTEQNLPHAVAKSARDQTRRYIELEKNDPEKPKVIAFDLIKTLSTSVFSRICHKRQFWSYCLGIQSFGTYT